MPPRRPTDRAFVVANGTPVNMKNRDPRFPTLYRVKKHVLDPDPTMPKNIFVFIQDTSVDAMKSFGDFEKSLKAPFGRTSGMAARGLINVPVPAIIYARSKGCHDEKEDVLVAFAANISETLPDEAARLTACVERIRGPEHLVTQEKPTPENGMTGGLHFERLGQDRVKNSRAISLSLTLQRATQLYGPAASAKNKEGREESQEIRQESIQCSSDIALKTMKMFAPSNVMHVLEETGRYDAVPHIGTHGNTMFPAIQLNISNPVRSDFCTRVGNDHLGLFGEPHVDGEDSPGSFTIGLAAGELPPEFEPGRFHLLHLGIYFVMQTGYAAGFSGLHYHVGTPPIAPTNVIPPHVTRLMFVLYPTRAAFPDKTSVVTPFASWPGGELLRLGPEFTTFAGSRAPLVAESAHLSADGDKLMQRPDFLNMMAQYSLLMLNHIWRQIPARIGAAIDTDKFMSAFSMMHEGGRITASPWPEGPDGSAEIPEMDLLSTTGERPSERTQHHARRDACLAWVAHLEHYSAFIPSWRDTDFHSMKKKILVNVPSGRKGVTKAAARPRTARSNQRASTKLGAKNKSQLDSGGGGRLTRASAGGDNYLAADVGAQNTPPVEGRRLTRASAQVENDHSSTSVAVVPSINRRTTRASANLARDKPPPVETVPSSVFQAHHTRVPSKSNSLVRPSTRAPPRTPAHPVVASPETTIHSPLTRASARTAANNAVVTLETTSIPESVQEPTRKRKATESASGSALTKKPKKDVSLTVSAPATDVTGDEQHVTGQMGSNRLHKLDEAMAVFSLSNLQLFQSTICAALAQQPQGSNEAIPICDSAIHEMEVNPLDTATVVAVGRASVAMVSFQKSLDSMQLQQRLHQGRIMTTVSAVHHWIKETVETALQSPPAPTWPFNLIAHFRDKMRHSYDRKDRKVTIRLKMFIPEATENNIDFVYTIPAHAPDQVETDNRIRKRAIEALQTWLGYLTDKSEGIALLISMRKCPLYSTLFVMDEIWQFYQKAFSAIIHGAGRYHRKQSWTQSVLDQFDSRFSAHPICDINSLEYRTLADIKDIFNTINVTHSRFSHFLRGLLPILSATVPMRDQNQLAHFVSLKADLYSPFRATTPSISRALSIIYADLNSVRTFDGLFNILCFRGVFYGSDYARQDLQWLDGYAAWEALRDGYQGQKSAHHFFVNKSASPAGQQSRTVDDIDEYYRQIDQGVVHQWTSLIDAQSSPRDFFQFLRPFSHIGPSTALLIVGDLAQAGVISQPTLEDMAHFIHQGSVAAVKALVALQLTWVSPTESDILHGIRTLHQNVMSQFTQDERESMHYDHVSLEHALSQYSRILDRKPQGLFE